MLRSLARVLLLVGAWGPVAAQPTAPGSFDCRMLARIPNAPMTVETCERRMAAHAQMLSALDAPGGERPGDEHITCDQIAAEMKTMQVAGVSASTAAQGGAAAQDVMSIMQRAQAEAMGMMGAQTARSAAAGFVPGNASGHAAAMANMAEQKAFQDRTAAQMAPARNRLENSATDAITELTQAMRANPRFARLISLGMRRECRW